MDFFEEQVSEERDPDLHDEEDTRMDDTRYKNLRDVTDEGDDKKKIHALRWNVDVKEKKELIKRKFLVSVMHPKVGNIIWTCVKDNIIEGKKDYKAIGLLGFDYKLFEEEEGGGTR